MKVLITGKGWIGTNLYNYLDCRLKSNIGLSIIAKNEVNYNYPAAFQDYLLLQHVDLVINCSGYTGSTVDDCEINKELAYKLNVSVPHNMAVVCHKNNIRFCNVGSGCIYQNSDYYEERTEPNFGLYDNSSFYSKTKHICELLLKPFNAMQFRIRMPVDKVSHPKNLLNKLYHYKTIVAADNSITYLPKFYEAVRRYIHSQRLLAGVYNIVEAQPFNNVTLAAMAKGHDNFQKTEVYNFQKGVRAPRSFCTLSNGKAVKTGLLDHEFDIEQVVSEWKSTF